MALTHDPGARRLLLLRHAKTEQSSPDHERELTARGRADAAAAGRWLLTEGLVPDLVLCSTAVRARQTWSAAAATGDRLRECQVWPERAVYQAHPADLLDVLHGVPDDAATVLLVGHNPGVASLVLGLAEAGGSRPELLAAAGEGFPTCTLAVLEPVVPRWSDLAPGTARLVGLYTARG